MCSRSQGRRLAQGVRRATLRVKEVTEVTTGLANVKVTSDVHEHHLSKRGKPKLVELRKPHSAKRGDGIKDNFFEKFSYVGNREFK